MNFFAILSMILLSSVSSEGQHELRNEANFPRQYKELEDKMGEIIELPLVKDLLKREIQSPATAETTLTEERLAAKILENRETIFGQLEGQALLPCLQDMQTYFADLSNGSLYAWQMRTAGGSFGRLATVLYTWRLEYLGSYDLCVDTKKNNPNAPFETLYCGEHIPFFGFYLKRGKCAPASCTSEDLTLIYNAAYAVLGLDFLIGSYYTCIRDVPWEWDAIFVTCLLGFFVLIVAVGTFYDIFYRRRCPTAIAEASGELEAKDAKMVETNDKSQVDMDGNQVSHGIDNHNGPIQHQSKQELHMTSKEEETDHKGNQAEEKKTTLRDRLEVFGKSCSAILTADKILSAKKSPSSLNCLNGIRVLSMFWVIWGHCCNFVIYQRLDNLRHLAEDVVSSYWFNSTLFASYSVDSFFVLSGLLVTYLTLKELKARKGKMNWFLYYFHRFWRLTPPYMIILAYFTSLKIQVGTGLDKIGADNYDSAPCREYWWTNLIYINNLYPFPGILGGCMGWSWYLACDMQFFIVTPLFILLLFNRKTVKFGQMLVVITCFASCIVAATLTGYYGLPLGKSTGYYNDRMENLQPDTTNSDVVYGKPYTRIQSYMVGIFVGYMLYRHFHVKKINIHWMSVTVGWVFAVGMMYTLLYALHPTGTREEPLPQWFSAVWGGVSRTLWSIAVAWVAFACCTCRGGLVNSFLSLSIWTPLARLTYGAYLVHPIIIFGFLRTKKVLYYWSYPETIFFFFAVTVSSYLVAILLSVFIEGPTMGLEKAIFGRKK